jgi:hypothetical protein
VADVDSKNRSEVASALMLMVSLLLLLATLWQGYTGTQAVGAARNSNDIALESKNLAEEAVAVAKEARDLSEKANVLSREANVIAQEANDMQVSLLDRERVRRAAALAIRYHVISTTVVLTNYGEERFSDIFVLAQLISEECLRECDESVAPPEYRVFYVGDLSPCESVNILTHDKEQVVLFQVTYEDPVGEAWVQDSFRGPHSKSDAIIWIEDEPFDSVEAQDLRIKERELLSRCPV